MPQWYWWIISGILLIIEVFASGMYFLWLGISAAAVAVLTWLSPDTAWNYQFLLFGIFAIVTTALWRLYQKRHRD
ncbi:MAG: NfeD family protein [Gammaproteobacteria bacterium]|nr:NfeD family protein [Gammaproteobacteria bacterium]